MTPTSSRTLILVVTMAVLIACENETPTAARVQPHIGEFSATAPARHVALFAGERIPPDLSERASRLGGSVEVTLHGIGVAVVSGLTNAAAAELAKYADVQAVEPDGLNHMTEGDVEPDAAFADEQLSFRSLGQVETSEPRTCSPAVVGTVPPTTALLYLRQWNMCAIFADRAWAAGHLGSSDVVVAILDTGIDYLHPDLVGLVDLEHSISFATQDGDDATIAERFPGRRMISDLRGHGTAMAATAGSNAVHLAGVNRNVTFLAVKIWNRFGLGGVSQLLAGIVYAADQDADVINVSGTYNYDKSENPGIVAAVQRAVNYAFRKGTLFVAAAGNDTTDLDHDGDMVRLPCEAAHVICASGTAPTATGGVDGEWTDVDARAPYSAFGRSAIHVAAPSGATALFRRVWLPCPTTRTEFAFAPACRPGFPAQPGQPFPLAQCQGTSCAASHTTGLAALLVAQLGHGKPEQISARILQSADDLGEPGTDAFYGKGRINIARALGVID
jgi:lantibiotic leader peptide-processing serine protease